MSGPAAEAPAFDGTSHTWVTALYHLDADPGDPHRTLGTGTLLRTATRCLHCKKTWAGNARTRCPGPRPWLGHREQA